MNVAVTILIEVANFVFMTINDTTVCLMAIIGAVCGGDWRDSNAFFRTLLWKNIESRLEKKYDRPILSGKTEEHAPRGC